MWGQTSQPGQAAGTGRTVKELAQRTVRKRQGAKNYIETLTYRTDSLKKIKSEKTCYIIVNVYDKGVRFFSPHLFLLSNPIANNLNARTFIK